MEEESLVFPRLSALEVAGERERERERAPASQGELFSVRTGHCFSNGLCKSRAFSTSASSQFRNVEEFVLSVISSGRKQVAVGAL